MNLSAGEQGMSPWHILRNASVEHTKGLQRDFTLIKIKKKQYGIQNFQLLPLSTTNEQIVQYMQHKDIH